MFGRSECRIEVLADSGIRRLVGAETWEGAVDRIRDGVAVGRPADDIAAAIERCGLGDGLLLEVNLYHVALFQDVAGLNPLTVESAGAPDPCELELSC